MVLVELTNELRFSAAAAAAAADTSIRCPVGMAAMALPLEVGYMGAWP